MSQYWDMRCRENLAEEGEGEHERGAEDYPEKLRERIRGTGLPVKIRDEVAPREIEEPARRDGEHVEGQGFRPGTEGVDDEDAEDRRARGKEIEEKRLLPRESRTDKDGEIADLLRNLMRDDGDRGREAQGDAYDVRRA